MINPSSAIVNLNLIEQTRRVLSTLTPREERVLRMRFGIGEESDHTLEEVGQDFNVTRERIRQIEAKALRKLRHPSRSDRLKTFVDAGPGNGCGYGRIISFAKNIVFFIHCRGLCLFFPRGPVLPARPCSSRAALFFPRSNVIPAKAGIHVKVGLWPKGISCHSIVRGA